MGMDLRNKIALITGASAGIGEGVARELARRGAHLALLARRVDRLDALAGELRSGGTRVVVCRADVAQDGDLEAAVAATHAELGRIDIAVANAGMGIIGSMMSLTLDDFRRQMDTNLYGVLRTFIATRDDLKAQAGVLAVVGSVNGYLSLSGGGAYAMSKFAVRGFCDALRPEVREQGITVTHIIPGLIATEIRRIDNRGVLRTDRKDPAPPFLTMSVRDAAQEIVEAISEREAERILTGHGKLAVFLARHTPGLLDAIIRAAGVSAKRS